MSSSLPFAPQSEFSPFDDRGSLIASSHFLVCGLGSVGQHCVAALKEFGVLVSAIDTAQPEHWEFSHLPQMLETLQIGDCRNPDILKQAGIDTCRSVLLVTSNEQVNIEAAFAVRLLNPEARIVVRSTKQNLNELVRTRLGNFVAFEATQLPVPAFAIAALGSEIRGFVDLDGVMLRVMKTPIDFAHRWCDRRRLHELNASTRRVLSHIPANAPLPTQFHTWEPEAWVQAGDQVAYIEVMESGSPHESTAAKPKPRWRFRDVRNQLSVRRLRGFVGDWWRSPTRQSRRVAVVVGVMVLTLVLVGSLVLWLTGATANWLRALYVSMVMLLGSYDVVYGALSADDSLPLWMRFMNVSYMMAGTASIAVLYALLTETLLAAKFQLPKKRPPMPEQNHVILIGLGRVGRGVAALLQQFKQPLVGVSNIPIESIVLPQMPLVVSEWTAALSKVNLETARSVVVLTDDQMANLEVGLMAHTANPHCSVVIRTFDPTFSRNADRLLPYAKVICAYDLAADAYVAAAFGENILNVLRLNEQTTLVIEYRIEADDTLHGLLMAEVAYGYGVVPILHQRSTSTPRVFPSDDVRLELGDRLVVLATTDSLHRVERSERLLPNWQVSVEKALSKDAVFDGATAIARVTDCGMTTARRVMEQLPTVLPKPLYQHQAQRLVRELAKAQVIASVVPEVSF